MALALKASFPFVENRSLTDVLNDYRDEYKYTPDVRELQMGKHWYVFEYGECMRGHRDHEEFVDYGAKYVGTCFTNYSNLVMHKKDIGTHSFPIVVNKAPKKTGKREYIIHAQGEPGRIKGELYCVDGCRAILELDKQRENTVCFRRVRLDIVYPYLSNRWNEHTGSWVSEERLQHTHAWIYIGIRKYWDDILDNGYTSRLVRRFHHVSNRTEYASHNMGEYFFYSKLEVIDDEDRSRGKVPL